MPRPTRSRRPSCGRSPARQGRGVSRNNEAPLVLARIVLLAMSPHRLPLRTPALQLMAVLRRGTGSITAVGRAGHRSGLLDWS